MSPGNKVIDKMIETIEMGMRMPDDFGNLEKRVIKKLRGPIETGYKELNEIIKKLDNNEIKLTVVSRYGNPGNQSISIYFSPNNTSKEKEVGYRELAKSNEETNPVNSLATISDLAVQAKIDKENKSKELTAKEIKHLIKFCDKIPSKLNKAAKTGIRDYTFRLPLWFFFLFNWNKNKGDIYHTFMQNEMKNRGYKHCFSGQRYIQIRW